VLNGKDISNSNSPRKDKVKLLWAKMIGGWITTILALFLLSNLKLKDSLMTLILDSLK
jgi:hypothetical protein